MKRLISLLLVLCVCVLGFSLAGCGGGSSQLSDDAENFVGSWKLVAVDDGAGPEASSEDLELMRSLGLYIVLQLNSDGSAVFGELHNAQEGSEEMSGGIADTYTGTWEAKGASELSVTFASDAIDGALSAGELVLTDGRTTMSFAKMSAEELEAMGSLEVSDGTSGARDDGFTPFVIADDEICTIKMLSKEADDWGDCGFVCAVVNNSERAIYVTADNDFLVDGVEVTFWGGSTVLPGETKDVFIYAESADVDGLDRLTNVAGGIVVWDADTQAVLASYPFEI